MRTDAVIVCAVGPPGAGKTSFFQQLHSRLPASCLIESSKIRQKLGAYDLLSIAQKAQLTDATVAETERALAAGVQLVLVDVNLLLSAQRERLVEVARRASARSMLLRFDCRRSSSLANVRRKLTEDLVYRETYLSAEAFLNSVDRIYEPVSEGEESFDISPRIEFESRKILGDVFGTGEKLGNHVAEVVSTPTDLPERVAGSFGEATDERRVIFQTPKFDVLATEVVTSDGRREERAYVRKRDYVGIISVNDDDEILAIREFRSALGATAWGIPGGAREDGEAVAVAARREFTEETGFLARDVRLFYCEPTISSSVIEMNWLFVAQGLTETAYESLENTRIDSHWLSRERILELLLAGAFQEKVSVAMLRYIAPWLAARMS